jgi:hypothetical protein
MALLVSDLGEARLLMYMLNGTTPPSNVKIKLYTNNLTPTEDDVLGSYTESTGTGYTFNVLTGTNWTIASTAGTTTGAHAQCTFTYTGAEASIYGYYVVDNAATGLLWAERFTDGPYAIPTGGGSVKITPQIQLA